MGVALDGDTAMADENAIRVLVVDDEEDLLGFLERLISTRTAYYVEAVTGGLT